MQQACYWGQKNKTGQYLKNQYRFDYSFQVYVYGGILKISRPVGLKRALSDQPDDAGSLEGLDAIWICPARFARGTQS